MQLTGYESVAVGMVSNTNPARTNLASYDLSVDQIIVLGETHKQTVLLQPQHMCVIISREKVSVPKGFVGYALPKTALCQRGVLTLNTGILDPGYAGLMSTTAINFDKLPVEIRPGDAFLRIVFHELNPYGSAPAPAPSGSADDKYIEDRKKESGRYPKTFLDIPNSVEEVSHKIREELLTQLGMRFGYTFAIIGLLFTIINFGIGLFNKDQTNSEGRKYVAEVRDIASNATSNAVAVQNVKDSLSQADARLSGIQARVDDLSKSANVTEGKLNDLQQDVVKAIKKKAGNAKRQR